MQGILGDDLLRHAKLAIRVPGGTRLREGFMELRPRQNVVDSLDDVIMRESY
jgi:hypothetical protein